MNKEAIRLIDKLYKDLYLDEQVLHHSSGNKYDKFNNIKSYIEKLESIHNKVSETGRHEEMLKKLYYEKYVIKEEDIPESYYRHQEQMALERGYGYVKITESQKQELQKEIIENQKRSLDVWLEYFLSEDSKMYPFWAKYWAFQGMLKLGNYNKEKGEFGRRTKDTVAPFCDLNREALAMSIDMLLKMLNKEKIEDNDLEILVKSGSFQKIYSYILTNTLKDNKNITKRNIGRWVKYNQGSDHMPLVESLQGYNTGWCTAGESTAQSQLSMGDFYVYYTLDENDEYKVPRVAIRMEENKIGEIRGVAEDQNIESEMEEVVEEKIKDFPDKEEYYKKVSDMKMLTNIYKKHQNNIELTKEDLKFIYEIESEIKGFGYRKDPRIEEILIERQRRKDLACIFDCREDQISFRKSEITKDTIYHYEYLDFRHLNKSSDLLLPKYIRGSLDLRNLIDAEGLVLPEKVGSNLDLSNLISAEGLILPQSIGGNLDLRRLTSTEGLVLPEYIGGYLNLSELKSAEGLVLPQSIGGYLFLNGLKSAKGLVLPQSIGGFLDLSGLKRAEDLILPQSIGGDLELRGLKSAEGLILPQSISGGLYLNELKSTEGLILPQSIGGSLDLRGLKSAEGLILPQSIDGYLVLSGLESTEGLILPQHIGNYLDLGGLESAEGLIIPCPLTYTIYMHGFEINPYNVREYRNNKEVKSIK